jgi:hypothetical protein
MRSTMLELTPNPFIVPAGGIPVIGGVKLAEREMLARPHIAEPRRTARQHKADVRDSRQAASAAEALGELPGPDEAVHILITGRFSPDIYRFAAEQFGKRKDRVEFLSVRTHAKLLLLKWPNRVLALESSANLRSCQNLEQLTVFGSEQVHKFHRAWIDELFEKGAQFVNCYTGETARPREGEPRSQMGDRRRNRTGHPRGGGTPLPR